MRFVSIDAKRLRANAGPGGIYYDLGTEPALVRPEEVSTITAPDDGSYATLHMRNGDRIDTRLFLEELGTILTDGA